MSTDSNLKLSKKGLELLKLYKDMVGDGYRNDLFNLRHFKELVKEKLITHNIKSILDYGSGRSDWNKDGFDIKSNNSAKKYFNLDKVYHYEPTENLDEKKLVDCVLCIDVLEHIFIGDLKLVVSDIYKYAKELVILQIACYPASATLPNGENAHITVRNPVWWKGFIDSFSSDFPKVSTILMCSNSYNKATIFETWSAKKWHEIPHFKIDI